MTDEVYLRLRDRLKVAELALQKAEQDVELAMKDLNDYERLAAVVDIDLSESNESYESIEPLTQKGQIEAYLKENGPSTRQSLIEAVGDKAVRNYLRREHFDCDEEQGTWTLKIGLREFKECLELIFSDKPDGYAAKYSMLSRQVAREYGKCFNNEDFSICIERLIESGDIQQVDDKLRYDRWNV